VRSRKVNRGGEGSSGRRRRGRGSSRDSRGGGSSNFRKTRPESYHFATKDSNLLTEHGVLICGGETSRRRRRQWSVDEYTRGGTQARAVS
jgi:hypothetical protein